MTAAGATRRAVLAGGLASALAACGAEEERPDMEARTIRYGGDPSQFGELSLPGGTPRGLVVVVHGGFWRAAYDLSLGRPLAASLVEHGWAAWNLEYRRVGNGGGTPATFDDVAAGIDRLADVPEVSALGTVVTLGHSAGGHLAVWAAGRPDPRVPVTAAVSQAGVLDLVRAAEQGLGDGAVRALLGDRPGPDDARWDPYQQVPLAVPVRCVHGGDDDVVPIEQSHRYVAAATAAGADATLTEVDGEHFVVIDPESDAWAQTLRLLDDLP